jgi:hypothetical protein
LNSCFAVACCAPQEMEKNKTRNASNNFIIVFLY